MRDSALTRTIERGENDEMIQRGKYTASQKLEKVCALWESEAADGPEFAEVDRFRRPLIKKWEGYTRAHGLAAVRRNMVSVDWPGIERVLSDFCRGGLTREDRINSAPAGVSIAELRDAFRRGALEALDYTEEDDEIPSVDILRTRSLSYPVEFLKGQSSALAIFVTAFLGRNDVMHILDAKIERVTLADRDESGLDKMKKIYPGHWSYVNRDYNQYLDDAISQGERYDVVSCDAPLFMAEEVAWDNFQKIMKICNKVFITNYTGEMLTAIGHDSLDLTAMSNRLSEKLGMAATIKGLYPRISGHAHHWVVIGRKRAPSIAAATGPSDGRVAQDATGSQAVCDDRQRAAADRRDAT